MRLQNFGSTVGQVSQQLMVVVLLCLVGVLAAPPGSVLKREGSTSGVLGADRWKASQRDATDRERGQGRSPRDVAVGLSSPGVFTVVERAVHVELQPETFFPDLDYIFMGYDILRGFPLARGHDPGFTLPIFAGDYSGGLVTADGLWNLPRGVAAVPDVSCVTSFSSEVVRSSRALSRAMDASLSVSGGGWGVKFSASASYQQAASEVTSKQHLLVISAANCNYYFVKLISSAAPPFHSGFIRWLIKLNNTQDQNDFIDFFQEYGTHYVTEALFGASFVYEHKMSASNYEKLTSSGYDVAVSASYSGFVSLAGDAKYSQEQKAAVAAFRNSVVTKTIAIGAPPPENGDALTWASSVQQNPLPVHSSLSSIENLFSPNFMGAGSSVESLSLDYKRLKTTIMATKRSYCMRLQSQGLVNDCSDYISGLTLENARLTGNFTRYSGIKSHSRCLELCYDLAQCHAVDFCEDCTSSSSDYRVCRVYNGSQVSSGSYDNKWVTSIRSPDLPEAMELSNTGVKGVQRALPTGAAITDVYSCSLKCAADEFCVAFTFCTCPDMKHRCQLYSDLYSLTTRSDSTLYFIRPGTPLIKDAPPQQKEHLVPVTSCSVDSQCVMAGAECIAGLCLCSVGKTLSTQDNRCDYDCPHGHWHPAHKKTILMGPYRGRGAVPSTELLQAEIISISHVTTEDTCLLQCNAEIICQAALFQTRSRLCFLYKSPRLQVTFTNYQDKSFYVKTCRFH